MKKVALVTVNFGGAGDTTALLDSIKKLDTAGFNFKVVVVDATPGEWIGDVIKNKPDYVDFLQVGENKGFAGNYNVGMRYANAWGADYILIINNDTLIGDKFLVKKLASVLSENPGISVVSPKIYFAPGYEFYKTRYKNNDLGKVIWYAGGSFDWNNIRSVHTGIDEVDDGKYDRTGKTGFVSGCCLMMSRDVLEKAGYFDDGLFAYFEDNDWQQKILRKGGKLFYCGDTYIYHKVSQTAGIGTEQTDYLLTRNRLYFTFKYADLRAKFAVAREMVRQLITGRSAQKTGIADFLFGKRGPSPYQKISGGTYKYPVRLSILISNYKTAALTEKLLGSIYSPSSGFKSGDDEVLVLDDASGDNLDPLSSKFPKVKFFKNEINRGFVASYNRLMEFCSSFLVMPLISLYCFACSKLVQHIPNP